MHLVALILTALAVAGFCADEPHPPRSLEESAFGIEFSMENIMISFAPPGGHTTGLVAVKGNIAYQNLMMSYFELCYWAHYSQVPPWSYGNHNETMAIEYQDQQVATADLGWYDWYNYHVLGYVEATHESLGVNRYANNTDVDALANAVGRARRAAAGILEEQYGVAMPDQPFVSIAAPSFMWTVESEPCEIDEEALHHDWEPLSDQYLNKWHDVFALEMSDAVQRAGFRREGASDNVKVTTQVKPCSNQTSPIASAGHAAFWNPRFEVGANDTANIPTTSHTDLYEGQPVIVVELNNSTLSFWAQQKGRIWSPWSIKPQLGVATYQDLPAYMRYPEDPVWKDVVFMIKRLRGFTTLSDGEGLNVYLTGDAWEDEMVDVFKAYLHNHQCADLNVTFRGMFAASDGAALCCKGYARCLWTTGQP